MTSQQIQASFRQATELGRDTFHAWAFRNRFFPPKHCVEPRRASGSILTYLLDTNIISELRKIGDGKADANVWVDQVDSASFFISAITPSWNLSVEFLVCSGAMRGRVRVCASGWTTMSGLNLQGRILSIDDAIRDGAPICISLTSGTKSTR